MSYTNVLFSSPFLRMPYSIQVILFFEVVFHWSKFPLIEVVLHWGHLPVRSSSIKLSFIEVMFHLVCLPKCCSLPKPDVSQLVCTLCIQLHCTTGHRQPHWPITANLHWPITANLHWPITDQIFKRPPPSSHWIAACWQWPFCLAERAVIKTQFNSIYFCLFYPILCQMLLFHPSTLQF